MKTVAYLQLVPSFSTNGTLRGLRAVRASTKHPRESLPGAMVLRLSIDVPDVVFKPVDVKVALPADLAATLNGVEATVVAPRTAP